MRCQVTACPSPGQVASPVLRAVLCHEHLHEFEAWHETRPWVVPTDWPTWNRGNVSALATRAQRARDRVRDEAAATSNTRPLTDSQRALVDAWHVQRGVAS